MHWIAVPLLLSLAWHAAGNALGWPWWWLLAWPPLGLLGFAVCQCIDWSREARDREQRR